MTFIKWLHGTVKLEFFWWKWVITFYFSILGTWFIKDAAWKNERMYAKLVKNSHPPQFFANNSNKLDPNPQQLFFSYLPDHTCHYINLILYLGLKSCPRSQISLRIHKKTSKIPQYSPESSQNTFKQLLNHFQINFFKNDAPTIRMTPTL